jgi:hypothetical protein
MAATPIMEHKHHEPSSAPVVIFDNVTPMIGRAFAPKILVVEPSLDHQRPREMNRPGTASLPAVCRRQF